MNLTVIGNKNLWDNLRNSIDEGRFPHSSLFIEHASYGALKIAFACAQKLLNKKENSWEDWADLNMVFPFAKIGSSGETHEDYMDSWRGFINESPYGTQWDWTQFLESGNKQLIIPVQAVAELNRKMYLRAFEGGSKVCIIWGAEHLNTSAANKLLKLLEEPPKDTYFILIAEDTSRMLPTLLSRCQQSTLGPVNNLDIQAELKRRGVDPEQIEEILFQADGSIGRALQMATHKDQNSFEEIWINGLRAAFRARGNKQIVLDLLSWSEQVAQLNRETQKEFLTYGLRLFRAALMHAYQSPQLGHFVSGTGFKIEKLAPFIHGQNILEIIELLEGYSYHLERNANAKMLFTDLAFKLTRLLHQREQVEE